MRVAERIAHIDASLAQFPVPAKCKALKKTAKPESPKAALVEKLLAKPTAPAKPSAAKPRKLKLVVERRRIRKKVFAPKFHRGRKILFNREIHLTQHLYLHTPVAANKDTLEERLEQLAPLYRAEFMRVWKTLKVNQRRFILRIIYETYDRDKVKHTFGVGIPRRTVRKKGNVSRAIRKLIIEVLKKFLEKDGKRAGYFYRDYFSDQIYIVGLSIESVDSISKEFVDVNLDKKVKEWQKMKDYYAKKRQVSRNKTRRGFKKPTKRELITGRS